MNYPSVKRKLKKFSPVFILLKTIVFLKIIIKFNFMRTFKMILKILSLIILLPFVLVIVPLLINKDYISATVSLLVSLIPSFFIIRSFFHVNSKKEVKHNKKEKKCPVCGRKMTWMNTPILSSELKTGGKPCVLCLAKINKNIKNFMSHTNEYSIEDIQKLISRASKKQASPKLTNENNPVAYTTSTTQIKPQTIDNSQRSSTMNIDFMQIAGRTKQLLETLEIMEISSSPDTIVGRAKFFMEVLTDLNTLKANKNYLTAIQQGIDEYKIVYYDKTVPQLHLMILMNPENMFSLFKKYYEGCLIGGCLRYFNNQEEQILQLKQQKAINNRINKLKEILNYTYEEMQLAGLEDSHNLLLDRFNEIKGRWGESSLQ